MKATTTNPTPCPNEVRRFLEGLTCGPGARLIDVRSDGSESRSSFTFKMRWPGRAGYYGDDDGWWSAEQARTTVKIIVQSELDREFGDGTTDVVINNAVYLTDVMITCTGYVSVDIYKGDS